MPGLLADVIETLPQPQRRLTTKISVRRERLGSLAAGLAVQRLELRCACGRRRLINRGNYVNMYAGDFNSPTDP